MSTDDTDTRTLEEQLSQCDGATCQCGAYGRHECACNADWTPAEVYRLRSRLAASDALLRDCARYLNPHYYPDPVKRIDAYLQSSDAKREAKG